MARADTARAALKQAIARAAQAQADVSDAQAAGQLAFDKLLAARAELETLESATSANADADAGAFIAAVKSGAEATPGPGASAAELDAARRNVARWHSTVEACKTELATREAHR